VDYYAPPQQPSQQQQYYQQQQQQQQQSQLSNGANRSNAFPQQGGQPLQQQRAPKPDRAPLGGGNIPAGLDQGGIPPFKNVCSLRVSFIIIRSKHDPRFAFFTAASV